MAAAKARAVVTGLDVRPADPEADLALLHRLVRHALVHWTPLASVAGPDGLWLDMTGATHLFGGETRFARKLRSFLERLGFSARIAIAGTPGAAHALARFGSEDIICLGEGDERAALEGLPLAGLRLAPEALIAAERFGLMRIGDLYPLPRAPLLRRLGKLSIQRLDEALGRRLEPLVPAIAPELPRAERRLLEPIGTAQAIGVVIDALAQDLAGLLGRAGMGLRAARLVLTRVDGEDQHIGFGTVRATRDAGHIAKLASLRIDQIDPGLGIEAMTLAVLHAEPLGATSLASLLVDEAHGRDIAPALDRLAAHEGANAIYRASALESDVPERAITRIDPLAKASGWPSWPRPVRLFARPERLRSVIALLPDHPPRRFVWRGTIHDVVAGDGPERIHGEYWRRPGEMHAVRDYFRVEDSKGARFWVFRRGDGEDGASGDMDWYLHGIFG